MKYEFKVLHARIHSGQLVGDIVRLTFDEFPEEHYFDGFGGEYEFIGEVKE